MKQPSEMPLERGVMRWGGLAGVASAFLLLITFGIVGIFVGADALAPAGLIERFPEIRAARIVENGLYLAVIALWFISVCPGLPLVRLMRLGDRWAELALGIALSYSLGVGVTLVLLYAGWWSPILALSILVSISVVGSIALVIWGSHVTSPVPPVNDEDPHPELLRSPDFEYHPVTVNANRRRSADCHTDREFEPQIDRDGVGVSRGAPRQRRKRRRGRPRKVSSELEQDLNIQLRAFPTGTLAEHCRLWEQAHGVRMSRATMSRAARRLGWSRRNGRWFPVNVPHRQSTESDSLSAEQAIDAC
jgi:hypothetical protein